MSCMNTTTTYGSISKIFHWLIFLMVLGLLVVGSIMVELPKDFINRLDLYTAHKITGLVLLGLMILRMAWVLINKKPILPPQMKWWEHTAARAVQHAFYVVLILMPLSGWAYSTAAGYAPHFMGFSFPMPGVLANDSSVKALTGDIHYITAWVILGLIIIHIAAALKHHFINKDGVLKSMLPQFRK